jgi:serine/threonine-protein phosphatase CPPED1
MPWLKPGASSHELELPGSSSSEVEREWGGDFTFVQGSDTQFGFMEDPGWGGRGNMEWEEEKEQARRFVRCVNALSPAPRFAVVCGDLVHAMPEGLTPAARGGMAAADRYMDTKRRTKQNADFKDIMADLKYNIPLICVCGNHDVGDRPTPASLHAYQQDFGHDYFGFWCGGMRALVLNSQLLNDPQDSLEEGMAQISWLDAQLHANLEKPPKHCVIFQHIPWFIREEDETDGYFSLAPELREYWLPRMKEAGVSKIFCGHYHRNAGGTTKDGRLEVIVTSAVGRQLSEREATHNCMMESAEEALIGSGFRVVEVKEEGIHHSYHTLDDLE